MGDVLIELKFVEQNLAFCLQVLEILLQVRQVSGVKLKPSKAVGQLGIRVVALDSEGLGQVVESVVERRSLHLLFGSEGASQVVVVVVHELHFLVRDEIRNVVLRLNYFLQVVIQKQKRVIAASKAPLNLDLLTTVDFGKSV